MVSSTIGISDKNRLRKRTLILSEAIESWLPHAARAGSFHIGDDTDGRIFMTKRQPSFPEGSMSKGQLGVVGKRHATFLDTPSVTCPI